MATNTTNVSQNQMMMNIATSVRNYLSKNRTKIIICTPCFGGMIHNCYFQSMLELSINFTRLGIPFEVMTLGNESLIQRARNGMVAKFLDDNAATHLMFIDADITFSWVSIVRLLLSGRELCGGCYPKKVFNWDKIKSSISKYGSTAPDDELMARSLDYVFNPIYHKEGDNVVIRVENGMAQVKDIGTGFMMIRKSCIEKMIKKYPETKFRNNVAGYGSATMADCFYSLFDCGIDPVSRVYLSEDYLFCKRWLEIGGELWLDLTINLNHTGLIDYKGALSLVVGEVDVLNKDMQTLLKQDELRKNPNGANTQPVAMNDVHKRLQEKIKEMEKNKNASTTNSNSSENINNNSNTNTTTNPSKKKKKNKKNKKTVSNNENNTQNDNQNNVENDGEGEEDSDDENPSVTNTNVKANVNNIMETSNLDTQMSMGHHC